MKKRDRSARVSSDGLLERSLAQLRAKRIAGARTIFYRRWIELEEQVPQAPTPERAAAIEQALRQADTWIREIDILADVNATDADVRGALARSALLRAGHHKDPGVAARMAVIDAIMFTAREILIAREDPGWTKGELPELVQWQVTRWLRDFERDWPEYGLRMSREVFWTAAEKVVEERDGISKEVWRPICDAIESAGLGRHAPDSIARAWKRERSPTRRRRSRADG
jgi:hypothetical protein